MNQDEIRQALESQNHALSGMLDRNKRILEGLSVSPKRKSRLKELEEHYQRTLK